MGIRSRRSRRHRRRRKRVIAAQGNTIQGLNKQVASLKSKNTQLSKLLGLSLFKNASNAVPRHTHYHQHRPMFRGFANRFARGPASLVQASMLGAIGAMTARGDLRGVASAARSLGSSFGFRGHPGARGNILQMLAFRHASLMAG